MKKFYALAVVAALVCAACENEAKVIPAESIALDSTEVKFVEGETVQLTATVTPADYTSVVVWSSSDESVATVDASGLVTAVALGKATVTATADEAVATCTVNVALSYEGALYNVVTLKDGNVWFAENLRYVPAGKSVSDKPADGSGVWYPANANKVADATLVESKGLLYSADVAFGKEVTVDNATSFEGCQGICPDGWHIPTNKELTGLVGHNSNGSLNDTTAPYYDAEVKGASIDVLNADGFNWTSVGAVNVTEVAKVTQGAYLVTTYGDIVGALSYVWGSTNYQVTKNSDNSMKNAQFYSFMSTINASNNKVTVAYGNVKSGYSVRCVKNK